MDIFPDKYVYLLVNILTIAYPLAQSFERRIQLMRQWKAIFASISIMAALFLSWDELFTRLEVWGFNSRYLTGIFIGALPLEEWLFFITTPFAIIFIHEVLRYFIPQDPFRNSHQAITLFLLLVTGFLGWYFYPRLYTSSSFFLAFFLLAAQLFLLRNEWMGRFYLTFLTSLIPFLVMNSWLTGSYTDEPIVIYNNLENMGLRIGTIPFEDIIYNLDMLLIVMMGYEKMRLKKMP